MKLTNKLVTLGFIAAAVTASAQTTLALYQRDAYNTTYIWKIGPTGQVTDKITLNKKIHPAATSFAVGSYSTNNGGVYGVAFFIPGETIGRLWSFSSDGTQKLEEGLYVQAGGDTRRVIGFGKFSINPSELVIYRGDTKQFYLTRGGDGQYLDLSAVNLGTYTEPVGVVDADGDGDGDILMKDPATGFVRPILFAGRTAVAMGDVIDPGSPSREIVGTSDIDGNGTLDLFFRKTGPIQNSSWDTQLRWYEGTNLIFGPMPIRGDRRKTLLAVGQG